MAEKKGDIFTESMSTAMMMVAVFIVLAPLLQRMFTGAVANTTPQYLQYQGVIDYRELRVDGALSWIDLLHDPPYTPWVHVFLVNDGPAAVEVGVNEPEGRFVMGRGETRTIDRRGADELINALFFVCPVGETSLLRATGEY